MPRWLGHRWWILGAILAVLLFRGAAAGQRETAPVRPIVIGSKNFTESRLLSNIMAQLIEAHTDLQVEQRHNLGGTIVVFSALRSGEIDLYPEYTGTGWMIQLKIAERVTDPLEVYARVAREFQQQYQLTWLQPFGFNNGYAIAMNERLAEELGVRTISDLRAHQDRLRAGVSHEFLSREDGFPGLSEAYDLHIGDLRGMEHGLAYEAIRTERTDLIDTYTTDGKLLRYPVRLLEDDRSFFPPYDCAPIIRTATLERHPEISDALSPLAFAINDEQMRQMNHRVEEEGGTFESVARDFLRSRDLLAASGGNDAEASTRDAGFFSYLWSRRGETLDLAAEHLWLTAIAVLLAIAVAVPIGILLTRKPPLAPAVLGAAGVIQTVPSLALLAFMIPVPGLGLGARSAIAALFFYALLPIVRNTFTGIQGVDADLLAAARGMGLRDRQILWRVELPLATRTIMAGIRTSTVISIGVATLAAFIGAGGLGDPILTGLQLNDIHLILSGAIPAALLALVADFALGIAERALVPKGID